MFRRHLAGLLLGLFLPLTLTAQDDADARRQRMTPGLMIDTGARQGDCDGLRFLPDGSELLSHGDDKVVRRFALEGNAFSQVRLPPLRWPIYRESRGMIYALDLPRDPKDDRVVIAGNGVSNSRVAIVRRTTGETVATLDPSAYPPGTYTNFPIWRARYSPDGKRIVLGDDVGGLYVWTPGADAPGNVKAFEGSRGSNRRNQVVLIQFLNDREFVSVNEVGTITKWNIDSPALNGHVIGKPFDKGEIARAEMSPDLKTIALVRMKVKTADSNRTLPLFDLATRTVTEVQVDPGMNDGRVFTSVRFSEDGQRIAVGVRERNMSSFHLDTDGKVYVLEKKNQTFVALPTLPCSNIPQQLAFHPSNGDLLAVAGGDDHEVTLWNLAKPGRPAGVVRSPGRTIWGVGLSADGKRLGFQMERDPTASHPSRWARGDWHVFDLARGRFADDAARFQPVDSVLKLENPSWHVEPTSEQEIWNVIGPDGKAYPLAGSLYNANYNGRPRCYTFIPANPARPDVPNRLVVGHNWGASVYDLPKSGPPQLVRGFAGHEGPTTAIGFSRDGDVLVTGSRDQTICGWSLVPWPESPELGSGFAAENGRLFVNQIAKGSPAWEVGLSSGDDVLGVLDERGSNVFTAPNESLDSVLGRFKIKQLPFQPKSLDATGMKDRLEKVGPLTPLFFVWKKKADGRVTAQYTTIRQRPLWRFFPTEKGEFISWLWRDYYYDTNAAEPDRLAGWQVHDEFGGDGLKTGDDPTPIFHPLTSLADARQSPKRVREQMVKSIADPDLESFSQVEPPQVTLRIAQARADGGVTVELFGMANRKALQKQDIQNLTRWELFVNDTLVESKAIPEGGGTFELKGKDALTLDAKYFVKGRNRIRLNVYNKGDSQGSDVEAHLYNPVAVGDRTLHFLGVGVGDYSKTTPPQGNLSGSADARRILNELCEPEAKGNVYARVNAPPPMLNRDVTASAVLERIEKMAPDVKSSEDIFLLFLAGHGAMFDEGKNQPGSRWYFLCHDTNIRDERTCLFGNQIAAALEKIPCRKVVLLDACHSGSVTEDQFRTEANAATLALTRRCDKLIYTACGPNESAWERGNRGLFTDVLIAALGDGGSADRKTLTALDVKLYLEKNVPAEFKKIQDAQRKINPFSSILKQASQTPFTFRADLEPIELFTRIRR